MKNKEKKLNEEVKKNNEEPGNNTEETPENKINNKNAEIKVDSDEIENLRNKIETLEREIENYKDRLLRKAAEFENYKRRTENDQLNLIKYAAESLIIKLLPVVDDFERSLQHLNAQDTESLKKGVQLIYDKLMKVLQEQGVQKIDSVGKPFDVNLHDALMQRKDDTSEPHTVLDEIEKGYIYKDRVIRHSKVIVNEGSSDETSEAASNNEENPNSEEK